MSFKDENCQVKSTDKDMIDLSSDIAENIEQDLYHPGQKSTAPFYVMKMILTVSVSSNKQTVCCFHSLIDQKTHRITD